MRYVALRFSGKQGRLFSDGSDTKYLAGVSNRGEPSAEELIRWHWQKAGTIDTLGSSPHRSAHRPFLSTRSSLHAAGCVTYTPSSPMH